MPASNPSPDFWRSSGWHLLDRRDDGRHLVTPALLRAYLLRPELLPVEESCGAERGLHEALLEAPDRPITPVGLLRLKDPDARENYEVYARFRDLLLRSETLEVSIQPLQSVRDQHWRWHVGLDAEATALLNALYAGEEVGEDRQARLLSLFRLELKDRELLRPDMRGRAVYLGMAQNGERELRLKPQNILVNLPLVEAA